MTNKALLSDKYSATLQIFRRARRYKAIMRIPVIFIALLSLPAYSWDSLDEEFAALNVDVRHMWSGGSWEGGEQEGFYRSIVAGGGYDHYKSKFYVQWVSHGSDLEAPKILRSVEISQLNDNPIYSFKLPVCVGGWECNRIELSATHTHELTKHKFEMLFTGLGKYEFVPRSL